MEPVKNRLTGFGWDAGTFIVDANADFIAHPGDGDLDQAARRGETDCVVDDRIDGAGQAVGLAHYRSRIFAGPGEGEAGVARLSPCFPAGHKLLDKGAQVDSLKGGA